MWSATQRAGAAIRRASTATWASPHHPSKFIAVAERVISDVSSSQSTGGLNAIEIASQRLLDAGFYAESSELVRSLTTSSRGTGLTISSRMRASALVAAVRAGLSVAALQPALLKTSRGDAASLGSIVIRSEDRCRLVLAFLDQRDFASALLCWPASSFAELHFNARPRDATHRLESLHVSHRENAAEMPPSSASLLASQYHLAGLGTALGSAAAAAAQSAGGGATFVSTVVGHLAGGENVPPEALPPLLAALCTAGGASAVPHIVGLVMDAVCVAAAAAGQSVAAQLAVAHNLEVSLQKSHLPALPSHLRRSSFGSSVPSFSPWAPFLSMSLLLTRTVTVTSTWHADRAPNSFLHSKTLGSPLDDCVARPASLGHSHPVEALVRECVLAAPLPPAVYTALLRACVIADAPDAAAQLLAHAEASMLFRRALDRSVGYSGAWAPAGPPARAVADEEVLSLEDMMRACLDGASAHAIEKAASGLLRLVAPHAPTGLRYADVDPATILAAAMMFSRHGRNADVFSAFKWSLRSQAEEAAAAAGAGGPADGRPQAARAGCTVSALGTRGRALLSRPPTIRASETPLSSTSSSTRFIEEYASHLPPLTARQWELSRTAALPEEAGLFGAALHFSRALASACALCREDLSLDTAGGMSRTAAFFGVNVSGACAAIGQEWRLHIDRAIIKRGRANRVVDEAGNLGNSALSDGRWHLFDTEEAITAGRAESFLRFPGAALLAEVLSFWQDAPDGMHANEMHGGAVVSLAGLSASEVAELPRCSLPAMDLAINAMLQAGNAADALSLWRALGGAPLQAIAELARELVPANVVGGSSLPAASATGPANADCEASDSPQVLLNASLIAAQKSFALVPPDDRTVQLRWSGACLPGLLAAASHAPTVQPFLAPLQLALLSSPTVLFRRPTLAAAWLDSLGRHVPLDDLTPVHVVSGSTPQVVAALPLATTLSAGAMPTPGAMLNVVGPPSEASRQRPSAAQAHLEKLFHLLLLARRGYSASLPMRSSKSVAQSLLQTAFRLTVQRSFVQGHSHHAAWPGVAIDERVDLGGLFLGASSLSVAVSAPSVSPMRLPRLSKLPGPGGPWAPLQTDTALVTVIGALAKDGYRVNLFGVFDAAVLSILGLGDSAFAISAALDSSTVERIRQSVRATLAVPIFSRPSRDAVSQGAAADLVTDLSYIVAGCQRLEAAATCVRRALHFWYLFPTNLGLGGTRHKDSAVHLWAGFAIVDAASLLAIEAQALVNSVGAMQRVLSPVASPGGGLRTSLDGAATGCTSADGLGLLSADALDLRDSLLAHAVALYDQLAVRSFARTLDASAAHDVLLRALVGESFVEDPVFSPPRLSEKGSISPPTAATASALQLSAPVQSFALLTRDLKTQIHNASECASMLVTATVLVCGVLRRASRAASPARAAALRSCESLVSALFVFTHSVPGLSHVAAHSVGVSSEDWQLDFPRFVPVRRGNGGDTVLPTASQVVTLAAACLRLYHELLHPDDAFGRHGFAPPRAAALPLRSPTIEKLVCIFTALSLPRATLGLLSALSAPRAEMLRARPNSWAVKRLPEPRPPAQPLLALVSALPNKWDADVAMAEARRLVDVAVAGPGRCGIGQTSPDAPVTSPSPAYYASLRGRLVDAIEAAVLRVHAPTSSSVHSKRKPLRGNVRTGHSEARVGDLHSASSALFLCNRRALQPPRGILAKGLVDQKHESVLPGPAALEAGAALDLRRLHGVLGLQPARALLAAVPEPVDPRDAAQLLLGDACSRALHRVGEVTSAAAPPSLIAALLFAESLRLDVTLPGGAVSSIGRYLCAAYPELLPLLSEWAAVEAFASRPLILDLWPRTGSHAKERAFGFDPLHLWDLVTLSAAAKDPLASVVLYDAIASTPGAVFPPDLAHRGFKRALGEMLPVMARSGPEYAAVFKALRAKVVR